MVQYTNIVIVVASALVASALPAIAAPVAEVNIEARSAAAKAVIDHALDSASRYTITQPLKKTVMHGVKKTPPSTNTVGFANSKYAKDTRKREFDDEMMELLDRELFDEEMDLEY